MCAYGSLPPMPRSAPTRSRCQPRSWGYHRRARSVSCRRESTHVGTRLQREAAIDKEMAAAPNVLSVTRTRDALALVRHISKVPVDFGELFECPDLTDSPHVFIRRGLIPRRYRAQS